ncbi:ParA family protein [Pasteurella multocida]
MKIITLHSVKGGVGKSTLAAQIAVYLSQNFKVAIMDFDNQKTFEKWFVRRSENEEIQNNITLIEENFDNLEEISQKFDFCIVDSAGSDNEKTRILMFVSDVIISPLRPSQADLDTLIEHNELIEFCLTRKEVKSFYLLNQCSTHSKDRETQDTLTILNMLSNENQIKSKIINDVIYHRKVLSASFGDGASCFDFKKENKSKKEIKTIIEKYIL